MKRLPLLISVPHAGLSIPEEVRPLCQLTPREVAEDGDEGAAEIYAFSEHVERHITTDVARAIIDLNRAEDDFRKDGVVKTHTCHDVPVYRSPPTREQIELLIRRYHRPYHSMLSKPPVRAALGVDCHTMLAVGPPVGPDTGEPRPAVCLGNASLGANPVGGEGSLPRAWFDRLFDLFREEFGDSVTQNEPFGGGYITRTHAAEMPWVQIEMSRAPTMSNAEKRERVLRALTSFCEQVDFGEE